MKAAIPTLTTAGWVRNPATAVSILFDYLHTTEATQSYFFEDEIHSLPKLTQMYGQQPSKLASHLETTLFDLYTRYFDAARVTVQPRLDQNESGRYTLEISLVAIDGDQHFSLGRVLEIVGSKILNVYSQQDPQYSM
jgi:hypothetical protein